MKKHLLALYIASFVLGALGMWVVSKHYHHVSKCHIVHAQPGCPRGSTILKNFFTERDGTYIDACMKPTGDDCVDELRPGESMAVRLGKN